MFESNWKYVTTMGEFAKVLNTTMFEHHAGSCHKGTKVVTSLVANNKWAWTT
jgi:hypothetical protein